MKFVLGLSVLVAATFGAVLVADREGLKKDLREFLALLPVEELNEIMSNYVKNDAETQNLVSYFLSNEFKGLLKANNNSPQARALFDYLDDAGLDIYDYLDNLHDALGLERIQRKGDNKSQDEQDFAATGGLKGLAKEVEKVMPFDKIEALHKKKTKKGGAYAAFVKALLEPEFTKIAENFYRSQEFQSILNSMRAKGIDLRGLLDLNCAVIGLKQCRIPK